MIPENQRDIFLYGVTGKQNIWHQAFIWAGDFNWFFTGQSPIQHIWRHRRSTASLNKTLLIKEDCLCSTELSEQFYLAAWDGLDVSVGQGWGGWGEETAGELCCIISGMAAQEMCLRAGWVTLQRAAVLQCCFKGNILNLDPFVAPKQLLLRKGGHHKL